jgi:hypothetical protein
MKSPADLLSDIIRECDYLMGAGSKTRLESFLADETMKRAFARSVAAMLDELRSR